MFANEHTYPVIINDWVSRCLLGLAIVLKNPSGRGRIEFLIGATDYPCRSNHLQIIIGTYILVNCTTLLLIFYVFIINWGYEASC